MKMFHYSACLIYLFLIGCASHPSKTTSTNASGKYAEDLSQWRPKVEVPKADTNPTANNDRKQTPYVEPKFNVNQQLDAVLDSIDGINLMRKFIDGFTIQVYSGSKQEDALDARKHLTITLPEIESEMQYVQPTFRVKAGKYLERLDAQKDYMEVKRYFPNAIIIPDKIAMN